MARPVSPGGERGADPTEGPVGLTVVMREWGRIGCIGFGGPPTHIRLLRELCVERRGWMDAVEFEDAVAACNLLPGPVSTQLAIYCARRVAGRRGAVAGGAAFIVPGLVVILALAVVFLGDPPGWVLGAGAGAGAAVAVVAVNAAWALTPASWKRAPSRQRWIAYVVGGTLAASLIGPWIVIVLLGCGAIEVAIRGAWPHGGTNAAAPWPLLAVGGVGAGVAASLTWVALKVGALSYGGGFVIIPLMQSDAVHRYHWMTQQQFANAVALGQITPGPLVQTVAVVGYAAAGLAGGLWAALIAFTPSFTFILFGADSFDTLRTNSTARAFLDGSGPAAIGAIFGSAWILASAITQPWQYAVLAGAAILLLALRRGIVPVLLCAAAAGVLVATTGGQLH